MTTTDELTAAAYLKLRLRVAQALSGVGGGQSLDNLAKAENLIQAGYVNVNAVLDLPES